MKLSDIRATSVSLDKCLGRMSTDAVHERARGPAPQLSQLRPHGGSAARTSRSASTPSRTLSCGQSPSGSPASRIAARPCL